MSHLAGPDFSKMRYWTEFDESGETLVMPLRRSWKTVGGALAVFALGSLSHAMQIKGELTFHDWIIGAILIGGMLHLLLNIITSLVAREIVRVDLGNLVHGWMLFGFRREKRYLLSEVSALSADREISTPNEEKLLSPLQDFGRVGAVNFDYRGKTIGIGAALDPAHARQVVNWIAKRAPRSVLEL